MLTRVENIDGYGFFLDVTEVLILTSTESEVKLIGGNEKAICILSIPEGQTRGEAVRYIASQINRESLEATDAATSLILEKSLKKAKEAISKLESMNKQHKVTISELQDKIALFEAQEYDSAMYEVEE